ncbi:ABC transporter ATP-binding protein [Psychrosphaera ytuae]|uniref:ABC transporter ATP-binding protein n=1 Tax=Psychrosphaera ytuae TaxID=2820710 RepID=A0A975HIE3_9GAMM|nr:ABC transporter ATP-binding protein [Psychrosphaera ytuae]QTH64063.1 ABC transporter ATP-binding protein [Psychrosphaera ytuae]
MNKTSQPALVANKVSKTVVLNNQSSNNDSEERSITILSEIDLSIEDGETVAIVGASGSGKSTLLGLLAGLDLPSKGKIEFYGKALQVLDEEERAAIRRSDIGFIFQQFLLVPSLTALENVMLPAELSDNSTLRSEARRKAKEWLDKVGLSHRLDHFPNQLSGGEQQRVAIARAFITEPKLLFADEPSANLDTVNGHLVEDLLFELNQTANTTLVLVTHDPALAKRCQRTLEIKDGQLIETTATKPKLAEVTSIERAKRDAK